MLDFASILVARMLSGEATQEELDQGLYETCLLEIIVTYPHAAINRLAHPVSVQHLATLKYVTLYFYPLDGDDVEYVAVQPIAVDQR